MAVMARDVVLGRFPRMAWSTLVEPVPGREPVPAQSPCEPLRGDLYVHPSASHPPGRLKPVSGRPDAVTGRMP
jgi:hypothetical protein